MLKRTFAARRPAPSPLFEPRRKTPSVSKAVAGAMIGGVPRITYGWLRPGSDTRRQFEKQRNPFVDLDAGTGIYYRDTRESLEAVRADADAMGVKGTDNAVDLYNEHRVVPDLYPEGFQWKHKLNTEYNQWRSNTWFVPEMIPPEHRGRLMANFHVNVCHFDMRVARFAPKVSRQWFLCSLYVGTGKGIAGYGSAVAPTTGEAKAEAMKVAFMNLVAANLEDEGPIYPLRLFHEGVRVLVYPSSKLCGPLKAVDVMCAFGFHNGGVQFNRDAHTNPRNWGSKLKGLFMAIERMRTSTEIAHMRGKIPLSLVSNAFPMMEETRRRKGMFAQHPNGAPAHFAPNRVVDNRLPDHLKKTYYDDKFWKDFFAGGAKEASRRLNDGRIGMRPDELRELVPPTNERPPQALLAARTGAVAGRRRRTLSDVLGRTSKSAHTLGTTRVVNPYVDAKVPTHAKSLFHLHR